MLSISWRYLKILVCIFLISVGCQSFTKHANRTTWLWYRASGEFGIFGSRRFLRLTYFVPGLAGRNRFAYHYDKRTGCLGMGCWRCVCAHWMTEFNRGVHEIRSSFYGFTPFRKRNMKLVSSLICDLLVWAVYLFDYCFIFHFWKSLSYEAIYSRIEALLSIFYLFCDWLFLNLF